MKSLLVACSITFFSPLVFCGTTSECGKMDWAVPSTLKDQMFSGTMTTVCILRGATGGGIQALVAAFSQQAANSSIGNKGPALEKFSDLESIGYHITTKSEKFAADWTVHIARNLKSGRFVFAQYSEGIRAEGFGKSIDKINIKLDLTAQPAPGEYLVKVDTTVKVRQPTYVKTFEKPLFKSLCEKKTREQFIKHINDSIAQIKNIL